MWLRLRIWLRYKWARMARATRGVASLLASVGISALLSYVVGLPVLIEKGLRYQLSGVIVAQHGRLDGIKYEIKAAGGVFLLYRQLGLKGQSPMKFNSRGKGARAELDVAKKLQDYWRQVDPTAVFKRAPLSGGWGHGASRGEFNASGDIVTTSESFPWSVEVKHRENWSLDRLLSGKSSPVFTWWQQAIEQSREVRKLPMLWFRKNREPWRIMVSNAPFGDWFGCNPLMIVDRPVAVTIATRFLEYPPQAWLDFFSNSVHTTRT